MNDGNSVKIAAAYIRVSTDDQVEYSPASQIKLIKEYAKKNNYVLTDDFIFVDEGISGRKAEKRPQFMAMIATAKQVPSPFDVVLVYSFSRFARNREDSIVYKNILKNNCGIDVISITQDFGNDKNSILIEAIFEAMDEYYSIDLGENVKRGMKEKISRGLAAGKPPYGYKIENGVLIPVPEQAEIIKKIFNDFLNGVSCFSIARDLNAMNIKTIKGNKFERRTVRYILSNPAYIGKLRWNDNGKEDYRDFYKTKSNLYDGKHQGIISESAFKEAQKKLSDIMRKTKPYERTSKDNDYLFRGLIKCYNCGKTIVQSKKGYMQCWGYAKGVCEFSNFITIKTFEKDFYFALRQILLSDTFVLNKKPTKIVEDDKNKIILRQLEKEYQKLERIKEAYQNGIDTLEEYKNNKNKIQNTINNLRASIAPEEEKKEITREEFINKTLNTLDYLENTDVPASEKNSLIKEFTDKIIYSKKDNIMQIVLSM